MKKKKPVTVVTTQLDKERRKIGEKKFLNNATYWGC